MKNNVIKRIMLSLPFMLCASAAAQAQVSVTFGEPAPAYVEPGPGYVVAPDWPSEHYDHHRHFHNDYWAHHHDDRGRRR